jgi:hypothetical protein
MSGGGLGARVAVNHPEEMEDAARMAYEIRDIAVDATPVRSWPDHVIQGTQCIVRSVVLNDRWHALTHRKGRVHWHVRETGRGAGQ